MAMLPYPVQFVGPMRAARDFRHLADTSGEIADRVMIKASPTAPESPFVNGRVWLLRLADGLLAWQGYSDAQGRYRATGLEVDEAYVAVGIDTTGQHKAVGAGPVRARKPA